MELETNIHESVETKESSSSKSELTSALVELLKVKTLVTLAVTVGCVWGFCYDKISVEMFGSVVTMVLTNYFRKGRDE